MARPTARDESRPLLVKAGDELLVPGVP